jgi:enolase
MNLAIRAIHAEEILDSRGNPTVLAQGELSGGVRARASVPSGASTGSHEAVELRDGDARRFGGKGVLRAVNHVNSVLAPALHGMDAACQDAIDRRMIDLDGSPNKARLGANAILAVSCAVARAAAYGRGVPLWEHLAAGRTVRLPVPMVNILSGGAHAQDNIECQDFLVVPRGFASLGAALEAIVAVHRATRDELLHRGFALTGVADEGGWGPKLPGNEAALEILVAAIQRSGFRPGEQILIAIDVAATHFFRNGQYDLRSERRTLDAAGMTDWLGGWIRHYPIVSLEDPFAEDDWPAWQQLTAIYGGRLQLIGDDLFATNLARLEQGVALRAANAILVKMNQIGTLTETFAVIDRARAAGYRAVISARSGETEDEFLADLAVASGAGQIKVGSVRTSERMAKYNRLLQISRESADRLPDF